MTLKLFFIFLALTAIFGKTFSLSSQDVDAEIKFEFFYGTMHNPEIEVYTIETIASIVDHPAFRRTGRSVVFHFDAGETARDQLVVELITSYLYNNNYNVIVIDYGDLTLISDENAMALSEGISRGIAALLERYNAGSLHFVGNGVGANIISKAAENVAVSSGQVVNRITGLNPTKFSQFAFFTDTIHTEETFTGEDTMGIVAFFVNGGIHSQPGCGDQQLCSREMALRVYSESVRSREPIFPALRCDTWEQFLGAACNDNTVANMGLLTQTNVYGSFFLQTNSRAPWNRQNPFPSQKK